MINVVSNQLEEVNTYIEEKIRPCVQGDGGDLRVIDLEDNKVRIAALNECSRCPLTMNCYKTWLEDEINKQFESGYEVVITIEKPYFWDK